MYYEQQQKMGPLLIAWSIPISLVFFAAVLLARLWLGPHSGKRVLAVLSTVGFLLFLVHVLTAYHYQYKWSHSVAVTETAQQTKEQIGFEFGSGIYFNFLFLICCGIEVIWSWYPNRHCTGVMRWLRSCGIAYMLFIAFNGTVIFKSGWIRVLGILFTAMLICIYVGIRLRTLKSQETGENTDAS